MSYVRKANRILRGECLTKRRPYSLQKDGELWAKFDWVANIKGLLSIIIEWTKGHAKATDIDAGEATPESKAGNDESDI